MSLSKTTLAGASAGLAILIATSAQAEDVPLSAEQSDPRVMGWMQGVPSSEDKRITVAAGDQHPRRKAAREHPHRDAERKTTAISTGAPTARLKGPAGPLAWLMP